MYNIFKPHIVELNNGMFAVRKFSVFYLGFRFLDLQDTDYWWAIRHNRFGCCVTQDYTKAIEYKQNVITKVVRICDD